MTSMTPNVIVRPQNLLKLEVESSLNLSWKFLFLYFITYAEAYSEPFRISKMERFVKIVTAVNYFRKTPHLGCSTGF